MNITAIADALESAPRQGAAVDNPEGVRYSLFSDTLLRRMARDLRLAASERLEAEDFEAHRRESR